MSTADGRNLFAGRFAYLNGSRLSAEQLYDDALATLFNAPGGGALHVENLKGATGEIALRVGDNDAFGVINVGDDAKLCKLCEDHPSLVVGEQGFRGVAVSRHQQAAFDDQPADRLQEVHGRLE